MHHATDFQRTRVVRDHLLAAFKFLSLAFAAEKTLPGPTEKEMAARDTSGRLRFMELPAGCNQSSESFNAAAEMGGMRFRMSRLDWTGLDQALVNLGTETGSPPDLPWAG